MNPFDRIEYYKQDYTKSEMQIYSFIKERPSKIIRYPIEALAEQCNTSKAAIIRFCKKIGYNGFAEFKFEMSRYIISGERENNVSQELDTIKSITALYKGFINQISDTLDISLVHELTNAIKNAKRVKIIGTNRTALSAKQLRLRMSKIGYDAEAVDDGVLMFALEDILTTGDLVIIFSISASHSTYLQLAENASKNNAKLALITMTPKSSLSKYCDCVITLPCISKVSATSFLDDQALFFIFIEILLAELASNL